MHKPGLQGVTAIAGTRVYQAYKINFSLKIKKYFLLLFNFSIAYKII